MLLRAAVRSENDQWLLRWLSLRARVDPIHASREWPTRSFLLGYNDKPEFQVYFQLHHENDSLILRRYRHESPVSCLGVKSCRPHRVTIRV